MAADPVVTQQAREWIDRLNAGTGLSGNWRLQVLQKRYRKNAKEGCGNELPMRIRRFANGCPWALVDEAIRYLISLAPYSKEKGTGIIYNGLLIDQAYRPTLTQWTRDEQVVVDEQNPRNGTYTLVQDLIEDTECEDSETADTGSSCSETTVTEWHWDDDAPGDLADYVTGCEQGVTYAITQVNRKEDGTFDWALVKRIAKTQHSGPVTVECSSDSRTTVETWDNLYGNETDGYRAEGGCTADGPVTLPLGCDDTEPGVRTQVQVTENPDCTLKAVVTRKESFPYTTDWDEGTACRSVKVTHLFNQKTEPGVPDPDVGETVQAQISKNEDDSYNAQIRVTAAPEEVELHWTDGSNCRPREVSQYTNMRSKPEIPEIADGESLSASLKKNDDCTWDATFAVTKPAPEAVEEWDQGSPCRPEHVTSYQNSADKPVIPKLTVGKVIAASIRKNDDCTWDGQVTVKNAPEGEDFGWKQGSACRPEHVTRILRSRTRPDVPEPVAGQTVQASISKNEDDCTYDAQITVREPADPTPVDYVTGSACTVVTEKSVRGAAEPLPMPVPRVGETVQGSVSRNDDCTYDSRYSVTKSVPDEMQWEEGNAVTKTDSHHLVNQHDKTVPVSPPEFGSMSASVSKNADCTYDISYKVTELVKETTETWEDGGSCKRSHHTIWDNVHVKPDIPDGEPGETVRASLSYNSGTNTWSGQMTRTDAFSADRELEWEDGTRVQKRTHRQYIDKAVDDPQSLIPDFEDGRQVNASFSFDSNNCTWNGTVTEVERPAEQEDVTWQDGGSCKPTHHTIWINRHERPAEADEDAVPGATKRVSLSWDPSTDTWSGQMSVTDPFKADEEIKWEDGTRTRKRTHVQYIDSPVKPNVPSTDDGTQVSASLSYNENNCTWNGQVTTVGRPAQMPDVTWDDGGSCKRSHHTIWVNRHSQPEVPSGEDGETVRASLSYDPDSDTWSGQMTRTDPFQAREELAWEDGPSCQRTSHQLIIDDPVKPDVAPGADGEIVRASLSYNENNCTWNGQVSRTAPPAPRFYDWDSSSGCYTTTTTRSYENYKEQVQPGVLPAGVTRSVNVSYDEQKCRYNTIVRDTEVRPYDSGLVTWTSRETARNSSWVEYLHGIRVFSHVRELPVPTGDHNWTSYSFDVNDDCTYTGRMGYTDLSDWWYPEDWGEGGIREVTYESAEHKSNLEYYDRTDGNWYGLSLITFLGRGNEGTEAYWKLNGVKQISGDVHIGGRTYITSKSLIDGPTSRNTKS